MCFPMEKFVEKKWDYAGLQCVVTRADLSGKRDWTMHRCGYVRVPPAHPWHGQSDEDIPAEVHGGLTFAELEPCEHEDGVGWWIGFDCHHFGDSGLPLDHPKYGEQSLGADWCEHYWTLEEVTAETERLAEQVVAAKGDH